MNIESEKDPIISNHAGTTLRKNHIRQLLRSLKIITTPASSISIVKEIAINPVQKSIIIKAPNDGGISENKIRNHSEENCEYTGKVEFDLFMDSPDDLIRLMEKRKISYRLPWMRSRSKVRTDP